MKTSDSSKEIFPALISALPEINNLYPTAKGHGYDYIPLQDVIDEIKPKLKDKNLYFLQFPVSDDSNKIGVTTRIIHTSGEWIESTVYALPTGNKNVNEVQKVGSTITYLRRYSLISAFGITGDTDLDGKPDNGENNKSTPLNKPPLSNNNSGDHLVEEIKSYKGRASEQQKTAIENFLSNNPDSNQMTGYINNFLKKQIK